MPLQSACQMALDKEYFKFFKKNLCRVPDRGHSAKRVKLTGRGACSSSLLSLSLYLTLAAAVVSPRARRLPARRRLPYNTNTPITTHTLQQNGLCVARN
jgi:hypothetical protein